ncbi:RsmD family RNA methyltransferase [Mesoterricola silvestris]|uniref:Methyltransferase small n=1 Tax=Mesoterricola silvestris TaxID=2927979 RepID=A0AA48GJY3_9BACT|nr:RsmD family RNA methyltransferase [Mesoterricola silvestris]BDU72564.1 methyltransferase small [Mesoterricola silvestris]
MRIIAGTLKGRRLAAPEGSLAVRPTADRAREALFSILQKWPMGPFLDLYAGTGAVGLEALSRGFAPVTLVEKAPEALKCLSANARGADARVLAQDVRRLGPEAFSGLAVAFADPPYEAALEAWGLLGSRIAGWLAPDGILVFEAGAGTALPAAPGLEEVETRRYGAAEFHIFRLAR